MEKQSRITVATLLRQPICWCLFLWLTLSEQTMFSFGLPAGAQLTTASQLAGWLLPVIICLITFACAPHIGKLCNKRWLAPCMAALGCLGLALRASQAQTAGLSGFIALGDCCLIISTLILGFIVMEYLAGISLIWVKWLIVGAAVLNALASVAYNTMPVWLLVIMFVLLAVLLEAAERMLGNLEVAVPSTVKQQLRPPIGLVFSFCLVSFGFGILQSMLYQQPTTTIGFTVSVTKLIAIVLFALLLSRSDDPDYPTLFKVVMFLAAAGFTLLLTRAVPQFLSSGVMATGFSVLDALIVLMIANLASISNATTTRIASVVYLINWLGYGLGGLVSLTVPPDTRAAMLIGAGMVLALMMCAIWLFSEERVTAFLWGGTRQDDESDETVSAPVNSGAAESSAAVDAAFPARSDSPSLKPATLRAAEAFGLSTREAEIAELYADGRSSTFVAEQCFLSSNTVSTHLKHIYAKCDVHSRQELITLLKSMEETTKI